MRFGLSSYIALGALVSAGAVVEACSSDDGGSGATTPAGADGGPQADASSVTDASLPDTSTPTPVFTSAEIAAMKQLAPLPAVAADPTNAFADNAAAAVLGQRLFFDKGYSGALAVADNGTNGGLGALGDKGKVACISCHASKATDDARSKPNNVSLGTDYGTRNALPIVNSSFYAWTNWGGRFDSQWSLPLAVAENAKIMSSGRLQIAHLLWSKYKADYDAIFPVPLDAALDPAAADAARFPAAGKPKAAGAADGPWEGMTAGDQAIVNRIFANFGKAIAAYLRLNVSRNAAFDRLVVAVTADATKPITAIAEDAQRGLKVFLGKGKCVQCHSGPNFSDDQFHNLGVPQTGPNVPATDFGRFQDVPALLASPFNTNSTYSDNVGTGKLTGLLQAEPQRGQFRTKSLRGILPSSAPFMHSGQFATLDAVVQFYSAGGADPGDAGVKDPKMTPLGLSASESSDLVAFLKTLEGEPVPAALTTDTSR